MLSSFTQDASPQRSALQSLETLKAYSMRSITAMSQHDTECGKVPREKPIRQKIVQVVKLHMQ